MQIDSLDFILGMVGNVAWAAFGTVASWLLGFFPDADPEIISNIQGVFSSLSGDGMTFNVMYFIDLGIVSNFVGMTAAVILAALLLGMLKVVIRIVSSAVEAIPVVE